MNKANIDRLWRALCACTCKPGTRAPYDSVLVYDRVVYATDGVVVHKVEGLFQPCLMFKQLHAHELVSLTRADILENIIRYDKTLTGFPKFIRDYDPAKLSLALRAHNAIGARSVHMQPARESENAPLIITSSVEAPWELIKITTAVQGMRKA